AAGAGPRRRDPARRPAPARPAGGDAGRDPGRLRPHAEGERQCGPGPLPVRVFGGAGGGRDSRRTGLWQHRPPGGLPARLPVRAQRPARDRLPEPENPPGLRAARPPESPPPVDGWPAPAAVRLDGARGPLSCGVGWASPTRPTLPLSCNGSLVPAGHSAREALVPQEAVMYRLATLAFLAFAFPSLAAEPAKKPNVVVILADDQGWGDLSINGNTNLRTPHIDALARDGARFERFFVQPVCSPTRAEFLTGRWHPRGGVHGVSTGVERLNLGERTVAEAFKGAGYATG